ncbi:cyclic AMP-dependent transcription factor ATF-6 alpha isoform X1 [Drosophila obscura]|uniref:cyclic AMP-dependent transcription factor ATF-6 alpha isoform X1 n=1 Tax=Drosophila obscura TaxID=7282 RepID=UPI000BA0BEE8|nr:cyclic AMP-dependent transcription factor ATF-6 alpha isoform X1 [Drosophila obscura]
MDDNDCFYNGLSLMDPSPIDYELNNSVLDDMLNSSVPHIDSSLDLSALIPEVHGDIFSGLYHGSNQQSHDLDYNLDTLSPFNGPLDSAKRTTSTSSAEDPDNFEDFISFLNDDNVSKFRCDNVLRYSKERNTPSPTGSCSSSSGSSTSGVQSDISDASHNKAHDHIDVESAMQAVHKLNSTTDQTSRNFILSAVDICKQQETQFNSKKANIGPIASTVTNIEPINIEWMDSRTQNSSPADVQGSTANAVKPKTIFLSSHDYKALMQKINLNGKKSYKVGGCNSQIPNMVIKTVNSKTSKASHDELKHQQTTDPQCVNRMCYNGSMHIKGGVKTEASDSVSIDEKIYKKQQRMIKNRESASLSRKKKKEYVVSLETRITKLERENYTLKGDNTTLRTQLVTLAKTCKCRTGNSSEIVLHSLSSAAVRSEPHHVKIAPKPKFLKRKINAATVKKNVAVLFAMAFMVTMNAGSFQSFLTKQSVDDDGGNLDNVVPDPTVVGRRLLWVETEEEYNDKVNQNKSQSDEMSVPPLHFLGPVRRNITVSSDKNNSKNTSTNYFGNEPPPLAYSSLKKCNGDCNSSNSAVNQSDYFRIAQNLQKWANSNDFFNLNMSSGFTSEKNNPHGFKLSKDYIELKPEVQSPQHQGKRKIYMDMNDYSPDVEDKRRRKINSSINRAFNNKKEHIPLFNGIKRKDDTFYVLSFNTDHILLPASKYNNSKRPKMSLLLPTGDPTSNGDIMLMQVDCEVFNTKELELKAHMIPTRLRPNVTNWHPNTPKFDSAVNESQSNKNVDRIPVKYDKPRVHTFFMVGPKNQAAAAVSQEKPRLVQFNHSVANNSRQMSNTRKRESLREKLEP